MLTNLDNVVRYTVSGNTYAITYPYWSTEEIKAYITLPDGTVSGLTYGTDFTVTAPNGVNGTLTKVSAWTDAEKLTIVREVELTQEIDLINGEKIDGEQLETGLDLKTAGLQQLNEKFTRSVMTSIDETGDNMVIPNSTARKGTGDGTLLGFDGTGGNIVLRDLKQFDADVTNTATNASAASASATLAQKWAENPEDTPVVTGSYSALHHANKAKASATSASTDATTATNKALDSEAYAIGKRNGVDVPNTDPAYHNNTKYYYDLVVGAISGALRYQGTWTTTGATDYSGISTPRAKGDLFYCQGTACTIDGVTYTQGDLIIFNQDVASTITTSAIDKIDNTETVTPDNTCTLSNKTIAFGDNTMTDVASTNTTQTLTNKTIDGDDNTIYEYKPAIGVPTLWMGTKPDWALDFGNGAATQYAWADYPKLNTAYFKDILDHFKTTGGSGLCADYDATGFYVPDLRGLMARTVGTNGKGYTTDAIATVGAGLTERLPNITGYYVTSLGEYGPIGYGAFSLNNQTNANIASQTATTSPTRGFNFNAGSTPGTGNGVYKTDAHVSPACFGSMWIVRYE